MKRALLLPLIICFACTVYSQVVVRQETTDSTELRYSGHIYNGDSYVAGNNIWAGSCVLPFPPYGNVNFESGSHVIMDAEGDVHLEFGVNVKLGATLEIR